MRKIIVSGSLNADLVVQVERAPLGGETVSGSSFNIFNGGKGANQAFAAGRLGADVYMAGRVGDDDHGRSLVKGLNEVGVNTLNVRNLSQEPTGVALITVETGGENRIVVIAGANGAYSVQEMKQDESLYTAGNIALFQLESPLETVNYGLRRAHESGCLTILDPAPAVFLNQEIYNYIDYLTPNLSELSVLSGKELHANSSEDDILTAARSLLNSGVRKVLAKLGSRGAILIDKKMVQRFNAIPVNSVDSTAAGDCFNGAFAASLSRGDSEEKAIKFACIAAGISVTRRGAQVSMPSLEETELQINGLQKYAGLKKSKLYKI